MNLNDQERIEVTVILGGKGYAFRPLRDGFPSPLTEGERIFITAALNAALSHTRNAPVPS